MSVMEEPLNENNNYLDIDDLYAWIDTIPLSRPKKNIARDFADGVLVAEIVAHFLPQGYVDLHNFSAASSIGQRKVNWQTLNRRVFSKMGMKVSEETISQLVDSKPCIIEQVLIDIRAKIDKLRSSPDYKAPNVRRSKSVGQSRSVRNRVLTQSEGGPRGRAVTAYQSNEESKGNFVTTNKTTNNKSNANLVTSFGKRRSVASHLTSVDNNGGQQNMEHAFVVGNPVTKQGSNVNSKVNVRGQGYVASPFNDDPTQGGSGPSLGPTGSRPSVMSTSTNKLDEPPSQIVYRGHKMIPLQFLDEKEKEMKGLETVNRSLTLKIFRLETLLNIKDQRIEDLTHQLQNLRGMYERITDSTFSSLT